MPLQQSTPPANPDQFAELTGIIFERFKDNPEGAVDYINDVVDRQIAKVGCLLAYNSILFAGIQLNPAESCLKVGMSWVALFSCVLLLTLLSVTWRSPETYKDARTDFSHTVRLAANRTRVLGDSLFLSMLSTFLAMLFLAFNPPETRKPEGKTTVSQVSHPAGPPAPSG